MTKKILVWEKILTAKKSHITAKYLNIQIPPGIFRKDRLYIVKFYEIDVIPKSILTDEIKKELKLWDDVE